MSGSTLVVEDLRVEYPLAAGARAAVDGVSLTLGPGERLGLVGESGSGKTTLLRAILGTVRPPGRVVGGSVRLDGDDLASLPAESMRRVRLERIAMVPQGAMSALNPVARVGDQIRAALEAHGRTGTAPQMRARVAELLESVALQARVERMYPHELSGGMCQRVCVAIAVSLAPGVILADEPTTALDVIAQRQIVELLRAVQARLGSAILMVGHDIGLMAQFAGRVAVMYAGRLVEVARVDELFARPEHPYTRLLIGSVPTFDRAWEPPDARAAGAAASGADAGCAYAARCPEATDRCRDARPPLADVRPGHAVACLQRERGPS